LGSATRTRSWRQPRSIGATLSQASPGSSAFIHSSIETRGRSTLRVIVAVTGNSSTGRLLITKSGATVCNTTASVVQDVTATCGQTSVDISLAQQADGTVAGQLVTRAAGP